MGDYPYSIAVSLGSAASTLQSAGLHVSIIRATGVSVNSAPVTNADITPAVPTEKAVVWVAANPSQSMTFEWGNALKVYQTGPVETGSVIIEASLDVAQAGYVISYLVTGFGSSSPAPAGASQSDYFIDNKSGSNDVSFGLAQCCYLNGNQISDGPIPICNEPIINNMIGQFSESSKFGVFLWSQSDSGVVINTATVGVDTFTVCSGTQLNIALNPSTNRFYSTS